ncbi:MAG: hypothetical protein MRECE_13c043 [Mycoplasmataceae bacterium CE_OT135]|nr:MAG: hypothetical protein MRECE_13c043 [Mycoplasmataceae bacterium CE_OT135]
MVNDINIFKTFLLILAYLVLTNLEKFSGTLATRHSAFTFSCLSKFIKLSKLFMNSS